MAVEAIKSVEAAKSAAPPGQLRTFWLSFSENKGAVAGLVVLLVVGLVAIFADQLAPFSPLEQFRGDGKNLLLPPAWQEGGTWKFVLGTDGASRDTLSRLIHGARLSLFIGLAVMCVSIVLFVFATGFAIDYGRAERLRTKLDAAADAAALAAVDPATILQSDSVATTAASNMFNSQTSTLSGLTSVNLTTTITDGVSSSSGSLGYLRKATVSYTARSTNIFAGILGVPTLPIAGTSTASAQQPPNVNFYVVMDNSPSMLLPSTSAGLTAVTDSAASSMSGSAPRFSAVVRRWRKRPKRTSREKTRSSSPAANPRE